MTFDNLCLACVVDELQLLPGGQIQRIRQPNALQIVLSIFSRAAGEKHLLLDVSPRFYRAHLTSMRAPNPASPPPFCMTLRKYIGGGKIVAVSQRNGDRILDLKIQNENAEFLLTCELMGKHANLILVSPDNEILHAAKLISSKESRVRETLPGREYSPPPASAQEIELAIPARWQPVVLKNPGGEIVGAYPVARAGFECELRASFCAALDEYFSVAAPRAELEQQKKSLRAAMEKTRAQKAKSLEQVRRGVSESTRAQEYRRWGELILGNARAVKTQLEAATHGMETIEVEVLDFYSEQSEQIKIPLDANLSASESATRFFERARHVEENAASLQKLQNELEKEIIQIEALAARLETVRALETVGAQLAAPETATKELEQLREEATSRRWLRLSIPDASTPTQSRNEFGGHKIKRFVSPDGFTILVGESATANDFLVTRLAHGSDWWLHLRGGTSSHAIVQTHNAPQRVPMSTLQFAAQLVAARSVAKHAGLAEVDYTLKKYVRKPRKAAPGSVVITNQKTLRVENE